MTFWPICMLSFGVQTDMTDGVGVGLEKTVYIGNKSHLVDTVYDEGCTDWRPQEFVLVVLYVLRHLQEPACAGARLWLRSSDLDDTVEFEIRISAVADLCRYDSCMYILVG